MGWTLAELDEQDMARVLPGLQLKNVIVRLRSISDRMDSGELTGDDMSFYGEILKAIGKTDA